MRGVSRESQRIGPRDSNATAMGRGVERCVG